MFGDAINYCCIKQVFIHCSVYTILKNLCNALTTQCNTIPQPCNKYYLDKEYNVQTSFLGVVFVVFTWNIVKYVTAPPSLCKMDPQNKISQASKITRNLNHPLCNTLKTGLLLDILQWTILLSLRWVVLIYLECNNVIMGCFIRYFLRHPRESL